ncbi:MAG: hypothetical protein ACR2HF_04530, partial [Methylococcaceae bacterium]
MTTETSPSSSAPAPDLLTALAQGGEAAQAAVAQLTNGLNADQAANLQQSLVSGLAANESPAAAVAGAQEALSQVAAVAVPADAA